MWLLMRWNFPSAAAIARGIIDDGNSADVVLAHEPAGLADGGGGRKGDRIDDDAILAALDLLDLAGLIFDREVLVNDADAAFLGEGDGKGGFGDGIHRRGDERNVELDLAREPGVGVGVGGNEITAGGNQQDIIEGDAVVEDLGVFHVIELLLSAGGVNMGWVSRFGDLCSGYRGQGSGVREQGSTGEGRTRLASG